MEDLGGQLLEPTTQNPLKGNPLGETPEAATTSDLDQPGRVRRRRRRRTPIRLLVDGLLPFAILVGLVVLAAGVVGVVEHGAAASSKRAGGMPQKPRGPISEAPGSSETRRAAEPETADAPMNLVGQQIQMHLKAELGFEPPAQKEEMVSMDDVVDWGLIEASESK